MTARLPQSFMLIAGEPSGDRLGAELVAALRTTNELNALPFPPRFFGAGGPLMKAEGVDLALDLTRHSVFGISDALRQYLKFRRFFWQLLRLAESRQPDAVILIDFAGLNRRFARALKNRIRSRLGAFRNWNPRFIYYVSPQVWASRESRARSLAQDIDLLLSIFPFEKDWYRARIPGLRVEFVGNPLVDRFTLDHSRTHRRNSDPLNGIQTSNFESTPASRRPLVLLLPGSRMRELETHMPIMLDAVAMIRTKEKIDARIILPSPELAAWARQRTHLAPDLEVRCETLAHSLPDADLAIASSGTVTMECAFFQIPTVVLYKTSWLTYEIGRRIIRVDSIAMPNIIGGEEIYPELIQHRATPEAISREALRLLNEPELRDRMRMKLKTVIAALGAPGASRRAAEAIIQLWRPSPSCFG